MPIPEQYLWRIQDAEAIPLETIKEIAITRVRSSGGYSHLLFYSACILWNRQMPGTDVNFQLEITTGKMIYRVITPFSFELKQTLRSLLGDKSP